MSLLLRESVWEIYFITNTKFLMEINPILRPGEIILGWSLDTLIKNIILANLENLEVEVMIRSILDFFF